jgi:[acyl-carrier-protein] S-malonyltransferase
LFFRGKARSRWACSTPGVTTRWCRQTLAEASDALGEDIGALIKDGPKEALALTTNTQPVMLVAGVAAYRVWMAEVGLAPQVVAGHSLGEYSALVAAGVLTLAAGRAPGAFSGAGDAGRRAGGHGCHGRHSGHGSGEGHRHGCAEVTAAWASLGTEVVEAVNFNDPSQTVIAGSKAAVEQACVALKAQGAKRALAAAGVGTVSFQPDGAGGAQAERAN